MFLSVRCIVGFLGMGVAGAFVGAAAGMNIATSIGLVEPKASGITILVASVVGALGGACMGLATFCCEKGKSGQEVWMLVRPETAQIVWVLLAAGVSLPYLAVVASTAPYLSHLSIVQQGGVIFSHVAGFVGGLLWVDGIVLQFVLAYRILREHISLF